MSFGTEGRGLDSTPCASTNQKSPKAVAKIADDVDMLLAFYDYPAEHWIHLRTTDPNPRLPPCGSAPAPRKAPEPPWTCRGGSLGSRAAGIAMVFKLIESAQTRLAGAS